MGLADSVGRLTSLLAMVGQIAIVFSLPALAGRRGGGQLAWTASADRLAPAGSTRTARPVSRA